jgi:hypothetical protein
MNARSANSPVSAHWVVSAIVPRTLPKSHCRAEQMWPRPGRPGQLGGERALREQMGGPRHSVERGHGSLRRDVARAASSCARRHRRVGGPTELAAPTPTITLRSSTPSTRRKHIVSIRAADGLVVLGGRGRPPDGEAGRPPGSQAVPACAMDTPAALRRARGKCPARGAGQGCAVQAQIGGHRQDPAAAERREISPPARWCARARWSGSEILGS